MKSSNEGFYIVASFIIGMGLLFYFIGDETAEHDAKRREASVQPSTSSQLVNRLVECINTRALICASKDPANACEQAGLSTDVKWAKDETK